MKTVLFSVSKGDHQKRMNRNINTTLLIWQHGQYKTLPRIQKVSKKKSPSSLRWQNLMCLKDKTHMLHQLLVPSAQNSKKLPQHQHTAEQKQETEVVRQITIPTLARITINRKGN